MTRQIDDEHAPATRHVADTQNSRVGLHAVAAYRKPKSKSSSVAAQLCKGLEHPLCSTRREPAAMVLNLDTDPIGCSVSIQTNIAMIASKFECVLQQVADCRQEQVSVASKGKLPIDFGYGESALLYPRFQGRGQLDFSDEVGEGEELMLAAQAGRYSNLGEGTVDQVPHSDETTVGHGTGGAGEAYIARPQGGKRESGGAQQVSQLMSKYPETLV